MANVWQTDFLVVGSGVAGLATALKASGDGQVVIATKGHLLEGNTRYAQGGIAAAVGPDDSPQDHLADTLRAGHDLVLPEAATVLVEEAPRRIQELIELGARFDLLPDGSLSLGREGAHSKNRILHARGDATGAEVAEVLAAQATARDNIEVREDHLVLDLLIRDGRCVGAAAIDAEGELHLFLARAVVIASGGCGQVYKYTTNPSVATGDGFAIARQRGVALVDMEFVQFHPTALAKKEDPLVLISEAVRGEGARLINDDGDAFMQKEHPLADLAPRDIVARAIFRQMRAGRQVYLDAREIGPRFPDRFPTIHRACLDRGIDPRTEPIPIAPAAHFIMGGIRTDTRGRTSLPGLYACGEVACTGVHGANRLASNSLLEGLVFSQRIAESLSEEPPAVKAPPEDTLERLEAERGISAGKGQKHKDQTDEYGHVAKRFRELMWDHVGIVRNAQGLKQALREIARMKDETPKNAWILRNMLTTGELIAQAALERKESRGGHFREDYPMESEAWKTRRVIL